KQTNRIKMAGVATVLKPRGVACASSSHRLSLCFVFVLLLGIPSAHSQLEKLYVSETDLNILVDDTHLMKLIQIGQYNESLQVTANIQHPDIVQFVPQTIDIPGSKEPNTTVKITYDICAYAKSPGHSEVTFNVTPAGYVNMDSVFLRITVMHSHAINVISYIMGWIYFAAWSVSFYPQIYINFKRKSVSEYFARHPRGLNPVQLNDVFFSLHAAFATLITITQCFIYEREDQRVSTTGRSILGVFTAVVIVAAGVGAAGKLAWLDFLYYCSYIKLSITLIKYVPQAYMNYKRKSTVGWSIGNIFLDFVGGSLSILQMALNAYNYNDWISFFGDATKFGLGLFSLVFDIFFILQHYVFYREGKEFVRVNSSDEGSELSSSSEGREFFVLVDDWHADEKKYDLDVKA
ncbi:hypothetical protein HF086_012693, partial [Spodoptera exigua]